MEKEQWRDVIGWEGRYQVSDLGNVRSLPRCWGRGNLKRCFGEAIIMRQQNHVGGYRFVHLRRPGIHKKMFIHRLVAIAFIENPEEAALVDHKDRDRTNNRLENLQWASYSQNNQYRWQRRDDKKMVSEPF